MTRRPAARQAYDLVDEGFGPGTQRTAARRRRRAGRRASRRARPSRTSSSTISSSPTSSTHRSSASTRPATPRRSWSPRERPDAIRHDGPGGRLCATPRRDLHDSIGVTYGVTGQTALEGRRLRPLQDALMPYLAVVVGLAFLLLMLVFRSILVPLTATLGLPAQRARHVRCDRGDLPGGLGWASSPTRSRSSASCRSS